MFSKTTFNAVTGSSMKNIFKKNYDSIISTLPNRSPARLLSGMIFAGEWLRNANAREFIVLSKIDRREQAIIRVRSSTQAVCTVEFGYEYSLYKNAWPGK